MQDKLKNIVNKVKVEVFILLYKLRKLNDDTRRRIRRRGQ